MDDFSSIGSTNTALSRQEAWMRPASAAASSSSSSSASSPRPRPAPGSRAALENLGRALPLAPAAPLRSSGNGAADMDGRVPHHKAGRVKVGIRCRPAFNDELAFAEKRGESFSSIVGTREEGGDQELGQVSLTMLSGKRREFLFDYVFSANAPQDSVYERLARPVVADVLRGYNGTIFAYGQTGTGKTYTMGILESVRDEHAGIIPRALAQLFEHVSAPHNETADIKVTLSFLQLYRETIQDLLAPAESLNEDNLLIRCVCPCVPAVY